MFIPSFAGMGVLYLVALWSQCPYFNKSATVYCLGVRWIPEQQTEEIFLMQGNAIHIFCCRNLYVCWRLKSLILHSSYQHFEVRVRKCKSFGPPVPEDEGTVMVQNVCHSVLCTLWDRTGVRRKSTIGRTHSTQQHLDMSKSTIKFQTEKILKV
jgi:hypothetical protein